MQPIPIIGVLALQGDYEAHARALEQVSAQPKMVRTPRSWTRSTA